ncbi:ERI1 exoribonuclease 2 [Uranotaenia lowii]|uniref:ERI1 exoribonuclease 2 n=1 Tax=Uranotaenia lowii TaxID=190385 RepID=UPI00247A8D20|nr:ERI1 exoribonuclease 2 [Uranotaenia lowii]
MDKSLFELAKALDAVDTIICVGNRQQNSIPKRTQQSYKFSQQKFQYLVVMDFEATCWSTTTKGSWKTNEIIEFPAVLLNLNTGQLEAEFQQYVMPVENPRLSEFCTNLTGIQQDQVDAGVSLASCLLLFTKWLTQILSERGLVLPKSDRNNPAGNVAFATWSDWDLGACLSKECTRKKINKPAYFDQWIDVRAIYRKFYQRQSSFSDALAQQGLQFEGRPHCGLDDAKNLARLIMRMCKDGSKMIITKDLRPFELLNKK